MKIPHMAVGSRCAWASLPGRLCVGAPSTSLPVLESLFALLLLAAVAQAQPSHQIFVTSSTGSGDLSTWAEADGEIGIRAADAICRSRAGAAGLPGASSYVAWISDSKDDASCRAHGLSGKRIDNCGQSNLPTDAGPWVRTDGSPFGGPLPRLLSPALAALVPVGFDELARPVDGSFFTGTNSSGRGGSNNHCADFSLASNTGFAAIGSSTATSAAWSASGTAGCGSPRHLLCLRPGPGPALADHRRTGSRVFLTSKTGSGELATWEDADGKEGIAAGDAVCQALAKEAGYHNVESYKAWLSNDSIDAIDRLATNGPWVRADGVAIADSKADLSSGSVLAPINLDEADTYRLNPRTWTGSDVRGRRAADHCESWRSASDSPRGRVGRADDSSPSWTSFGTGNSCNTTRSLYCFEDAPPSVAGCVEDVDTLCLGRGRRFQVEIDWQSNTDSGAGRAVDVGRVDSGLFTFFDPNNLELLVKVLEGCSINQHFWVFVAATTNVGYELLVTDTVTGTTREYSNLLGVKAEPVQDIVAFDCAGG